MSAGSAAATRWMTRSSAAASASFIRTTKRILRRPEDEIRNTRRMTDGHHRVEHHGWAVVVLQAQHGARIAPSRLRGGGRGQEVVERSAARDAGEFLLGEEVETGPIVLQRAFERFRDGAAHEFEGLAVVFAEGLGAQRVERDDADRGPGVHEGNAQEALEPGSSPLRRSSRSSAESAFDDRRLLAATQPLTLCPRGIRRSCTRASPYPTRRRRPVRRRLHPAGRRPRGSRVPGAAVGGTPRRRPPPRRHPRQTREILAEPEQGGGIREPQLDRHRLRSSSFATAAAAATVTAPPGSAPVRRTARCARSPGFARIRGPRRVVHRPGALAHDRHGRVVREAAPVRAVIPERIVAVDHRQDPRADGDGFARSPSG